MKLLFSQIEFEKLIGLQEPEQGEVIPEFSVIYFTASWCGPCRRLDSKSVEEAFPGVNFLKCDIDENNYTPGYCGITKIPTFMVVSKGKVGEQLQSSDAKTVIAWVGEQLEKAGLSR
jgi:thioredoxin 1